MTLDEKMLSLNEAIQEYIEKQEELKASTNRKEIGKPNQQELQGLS